MSRRSEILCVTLKYLCKEWCRNNFLKNLIFKVLRPKNYQVYAPKYKHFVCKKEMTALVQQISKQLFSDNSQKFVCNLRKSLQKMM